MALITILMHKALKAMSKYKWYLSKFVAFIRLNQFVKIELHKWLDQPFTDPKPPPLSAEIQGLLFAYK
jgi:hypothetical protein